MDLTITDYQKLLLQNTIKNEHGFNLCIYY